MYYLHSPEPFAVHAIRFQSLLKITFFFMWVSGDWYQAVCNIMQRRYENIEAK